MVRATIVEYSAAKSVGYREDAMSGSAHNRRTFLAGASAAAALGGTLIATPGARADEDVTYLFPAPPILPAFGPIRLAQGKGYFKEAGLNVTFAVGRGGVDVAKQVGAGNAP